MHLYQVLLLTAVVVWIYILWKRRKLYLIMQQLPGPRGYPIVGCLFTWKLYNIETIFERLEALHAKYGNCFCLSMGPDPLLLVSEPEIVKDILTSPHCVNKATIYNELDRVAGVGLFSLKEPEWSRHRKLLSPAFGDKVLRSFIPTFNKYVDGLVKVFDGAVGCKAVDIYLEINNMSLCVAEETIMGIKSPAIASKFNKRDLSQHFHCLMQNIMAAMQAPWLSLSLVKRWKGIYEPFREAGEAVDAFVENAVAEKLKSLSTENAPALDKVAKNTLINRAMELHLSGEFSLKEVRNEIYVTTAAAFDTTANTIFYTIMLLAMFPEYQEKVFDELKELFPDISNISAIDYEVLKEMTYMDMVINETMRLLAPVPLVARRAMQDVRLSNGIVLPAGLQLFMNVFHMHRREDIWGPHAHTFYPDHFLPTNFARKHSYAFIPFTKGIRNCIGWRYGLLSLKISLAKLLRTYRFTTKSKFEDLQYVSSISIKLKEFPLFEIHKRAN